MIELYHEYQIPIMSFLLGVMFGVLSFTAAAFGLIVWHERAEHKAEQKAENGN